LVIKRRIFQNPARGRGIRPHQRYRVPRAASHSRRFPACWPWHLFKERNRHLRRHAERVI